MTALIFLVPEERPVRPPDTPVQPPVPLAATLPPPAPTTNWPAAMATAAPALVTLSPRPAPPTPTLTPSPAGSVTFRGVEITQGIQVFDEPENPRCQPGPGQPGHVFCNNSVPLVAGRNTLARVYPACQAPCPVTATTLQLRLLKGGQQYFSQARLVPAEMLQRVNGLPLSELRLHLENSINFEFFPPPNWLTGEITFELETLPTGAGQAPARYTLTREFSPRKLLRVAYLPIQVQGLLPPDSPDMDHWLLRMYPVSGVEYYRLPVPDLVWNGALNKGEVLRRLLYTYWLYVQNQPAEAWPDQLFGWLPQQVYNGGASDPFWCPDCAGPHSSRIAFGGLRPEQDIGGPRILVHEIAHNLGARHAWSPTQEEDGACFKAKGVDIQVDPAWPYNQTARIQEFGIDLYSQPPAIYSPSFYDMMAYCAQPWISPYTYQKIFESPFLQPGALTSLSPAGFNPGLATGANGSLLVSGVVYPDGTVGRPEIIRLEGNAFPAAELFDPPPGDDYCLEIGDPTRGTLAQRCFNLGFTDLETGRAAESSPFFVTLPADQLPATAQVTLRRHSAPLLTLAPTRHAPAVTVLSPNGGEMWTGQQTVSWQADDADGDSLHYDVLYSPDGGQSWLPLAVHLAEDHYTFFTDQVPASQDALVRVVASDGFHTVSDDADGSFTVTSSPQNSLSLVGPAQIKPGQTFEVALKAHHLADPGLFGLQFRLVFDPARLQVDGVRLHPALSLVVNQSIANEAGEVRVAASRQGRVDNLTGDLTLATLTMTALPGEGQVPLTLTDVLAGARGGRRLDIATASGLSLRIAP